MFIEDIVGVCTRFTRGESRGLLGARLGRELKRYNGFRRMWISISLQLLEFYPRVYECFVERIGRRGEESGRMGANNLSREVVSPIQ